MKTQINLYEITRYLATFVSQVKLENQSGHFDINKYAEGFLIPMFNEVFKKQFERLETAQVNYPAVDLRSKDKEISIQVTSETGFEKIRDTLSKFISGKHYETSRLIHFVIDDEYMPRKTDDDLSKIIDEEFAKLNLVGRTKMEFSTSSIWNISKLRNEIENNCSEAQQKKIRDFLKSEYGDVTKLPTFRDVLIPYQIVYESQIKPSSTNLPFQFSNPFFGRENDLKTMTDFITADNGSAITIVADGGYGKTRLCVEFFKTVIDAMPDAEAVVLNEMAFQGSIPLNESQSNKRVIILIDDAHRKTEMLESIFAATGAHKNIKLFLTIRKPLYDETMRALPSHLRNVKSISLTRLSYDHTLELIKSQVPGLDEKYRKRVAEESKGVPIVILGLCQIIREGKYSAEISEEENFIRFVREVKDQVISDISSKYYIDGKSINKTVQLLALLGPVKNTEDEIRDLAAINSIAYEDCSMILSYLEEHELIQRKSTISILPDPYADIIILDTAPRIKFLLHANGIDRFTDRIIRNIVGVEHSDRLKVDVDSIIIEFIASISTNKLTTLEEVESFNNNLETLKHFAYKKPKVVSSAIDKILKITEGVPEFWNLEPFSRFRETRGHLDTLISIVALNTHGEKNLNNIVELVRQCIVRSGDFTLLTKAFRYREYDFGEYRYYPQIPCERQQFLIKKLMELLKGDPLSDFDAQFIVTGLTTMLRLDFAIEESFDKYKHTLSYGTAQVIDNEITKAIRDSAIASIIELFRKMRNTAIGVSCYDTLLRMLHFTIVPAHKADYVLNQSSQIDLVSSFLKDFMTGDPTTEEKAKLNRQLKLFSRREVKKEYRALYEKLSTAATSATNTREKIELILRGDYFDKKKYFNDQLKGFLLEYGDWPTFYQDSILIRQNLKNAEVQYFSDLLNYLIDNHPQQSKELYAYVRQESPQLTEEFCPLILANGRDTDYFYTSIDDLWVINTEEAKQSVIYLLTFGRKRDKTLYDKRDLKYVQAVLDEQNQSAMRRLCITLPDFIDIDGDLTFTLCGTFLDNSTVANNTEMLIHSLFERKDYLPEHKNKLRQLAFDKTIPLMINSHYVDQIITFLEDNFGFNVMFSYFIKKLDFQENKLGLYSVDFSGLHGNPNISQDQKEDNLLKVIEWYSSLEKPSMYTHLKVVEVFAFPGIFSKSFRKKIEIFADKNGQDMAHLAKLCEALDVFDDKEGELLDFLISIANRATKLEGYSIKSLESIFGSEFIYNGGGKSKSGPGPYPKDLARHEQLTELLKRADLEKDVREIFELALKIAKQSIDSEIKEATEEW